VYNGDSCVIDPGWRHTLYQEKEEAAYTETLSMKHLLEVRGAVSHRMGLRYGDPPSPLLIPSLWARRRCKEMR
jgi:hypothetical protein